MKRREEKRDNKILNENNQIRVLVLCDQWQQNDSMLRLYIAVMSSKPSDPENFKIKIEETQNYPKEAIL